MFLAYEDEYHPQVKKDVKKLDKQVVENVLNDHLPVILENPNAVGEMLTGDLSGIRSYHFNLNSTQYRIAYMIKEQVVTVLFLSIAKRENFYTLLKKRV